MQREYRIREQHGKFIVEVEEEVDLWWWNPFFSRPAKKWFICNQVGTRKLPDPDYSFKRNDRNTACVCHSLKDAERCVYRFVPKFHENEGTPEKPINVFEDYELSAIESDIRNAMDTKQMDVTDTSIRTSILEKIQQLRIK